MDTPTFLLKNTPMGTVVVKFFQVVPYSWEAFEQQLMADYLRINWEDNQVLLRSSTALYQGLVLRNTVLIPAIAKLSEQYPMYNCVRIEREIPSGASW
jgi:hypothetical protein